MSMLINSFRFAAAGGGGDPLPVSGAVGWWDASDASTITSSGGAVSQWNDKSGSGRHFTQATAAAKPTTAVNTLNSLNVLKFDGGDHMDTGSFTQAQPMTIFFVHRRSATNFAAVFCSVGGNLQVAYSAGSETRYFAGTERFAFTLVADTWSVEQYVINGATSASWRNATAGGAGNAGTAGTTTGFRLGAERSGSPKITGDIAEVVVYPSALSTTDRETVRDYLNTKWAVY